MELTSVEFNLLQVLLREAGRVVTREFLVDAVLSRKFSPFDRSIDMHVSKIRKKLGDADSNATTLKRLEVSAISSPFPGTPGQEQRQMRSLFLKIFVSFWLALAVFLVLAILMTLVVRARGRPPLGGAAWYSLQQSDPDLRTKRRGPK